jgi:hypothetical protein
MNCPICYDPCFKTYSGWRCEEAGPSHLFYDYLELGYTIWFFENAGSNNKYRFEAGAHPLKSNRIDSSSGWVSIIYLLDDRVIDGQEIIYTDANVYAHEEAIQLLSKVDKLRSFL